MQVQPEDRPNNIHRKEDRTTRPPRTEKTLPRDHPNTSHYTPHLDLSPTAKQITVFNFYYNFYRNTNILCHSLPRLHLPLLTSVHSGHPVLPPTPPTTTTPTISPHLPIPSPLFLPPPLSRYRVPVRRASIPLLFFTNETIRNFLGPTRGVGPTATGVVSIMHDGHMGTICDHTPIPRAPGPCSDIRVARTRQPGQQFTRSTNNS